MGLETIKGPLKLICCADRIILAAVVNSVVNERVTFVDFLLVSGAWPTSVNPISNTVLNVSALSFKFVS